MKTIVNSQGRKTNVSKRKHESSLLFFKLETDQRTIKFSNQSDWIDPKNESVPRATWPISALQNGNREAGWNVADVGRQTCLV